MKRLALLSFLALAAGSCARKEDPVSTGPDAKEIDAARRLLADRRQPWWNGHALPPAEPPKLKMADTGDWASMNYNPPGTPVLPIVVARILESKSAAVEGTPFAGRPILFLDIRPASDFYVEHIPGSVNVPVRDLAKLPGDLDLKSIVIVAGEQYPHHAVMDRVKAVGFGAAYCLEGGLRSWKASSYPMEGRRDALEYRRLLEKDREIVPGSGPSPDFMGLGPLALKSLIDSGANLKILFVGDEETYKAGHIPGATRGALGEIEAAVKDFSKDQLIAVYCGCCQGRAGGYSEAAALKLRQMGYTKVLHLDGHLGAWREAGYPIVSTSK